MLKQCNPAKSFLLMTFFFAVEIYALSNNPIISRNKEVVGSPSTNIGILVNGKYGGETWNVSNGSWVAIKLDGNYSKVLINWNNTGYSWSDEISSETSCKQNMSSAIPLDYNILTSSNSTNGSDGEWSIALSVKNNVVSARSHIIEFSDAKWIKMFISKGGGSIDEIEVFDLSNEGEDIWFFPGTSITANSFKSTPPAKSFADLINESHPEFNPAIIRAGIPCINSTTMANDISKYLDVARNAKYWAIEMGTNDAWNGSNYNAPAFKKNMQLIIDSCKANNIQPIIARIIGADASKTGWQVHPDFLKAIDTLAIENKLIPGPDLYTYFSTHTSELSDGVHPNAIGGASVFRLWAEKMDSLYSESTSVAGNQIPDKKSHSLNIILKKNNGQLFINTKCAGTLTIYSLRGAFVEMSNMPANGSYKLNNKKGIFIAQFSSINGKEIVKVSNH